MNSLSLNSFSHFHFTANCINENYYYFFIFSYFFGKHFLHILDEEKGIALPIWENSLQWYLIWPNKILVVKQHRMRRMWCWKWWPRRFGRTPVLYWPILAASTGERRTDNYKLQGGRGSNLFLLCLPTAPRRQTLSLHTSLRLPRRTAILLWDLFKKHTAHWQCSSNHWITITIVPIKLITSRFLVLVFLRDTWYSLMLSLVFQHAYTQKNIK